ncbi:fumarylacetoacetate hydrolase family protein [Cellulomonas sp. RIT-PI-Y]|uniref:fumarylacetoacetate hydrolase family protein n=1 Tax=Cellulomonas sp. RIT-PI-Y TaxID=3035297 RepID=UPI0021DAC3B0|nr:fumarylacetoacetate hydrolase family protein [Cellulomonas sp. RIT-PI-Y]
MRLVTLRQHGGDRPGAVLRASDGTDRVLDLADRTGGRGVEALLSDDRLLTEVRALVSAADPDGLPGLDSVRLGPPVRPGKILCLGYNYRGHLETSDDPDHPNVFVKTPNVICGPDDPVTLWPTTPDVDYEGEIAVVIGRWAHRVSEADALGHVGGYTLFNDVSDRDWQSRTNQWALGKSVDGFGPLGPWLVTSDECGDLRGRSVEVERNGEVTVRSTTDAMVFGVAFLVHYLSQVITLEPGDVISTGTPARTGPAQAAHRSLTSGDVVTVRVTGLGALTTTFI